MAGESILPDGVSTETWSQRVERRFKHIAETRPLDPIFSEDQNRSLMIDNAQFQADKEMLNEIHLMLRLILPRTGW